MPFRTLLACCCFGCAGKKSPAGLLVFGVIFILAGIFNFYTASTTPEVYQQYATGALFDFYVNFIHGFFRRHAEIIVKLIAAGQMLVGILLLIKKGEARFSGVFGGILFLIAIAPLGIGSAFPATLIMALALFTGYKKSLTARKGEIT
jgi:hypothetical protein